MFHVARRPVAVEQRVLGPVQRNQTVGVRRISNRIGESSTCYGDPYPYHLQRVQTLQG